ncbi:MAG: tRNA (guanosine(37)-N1)-methyltransferase TrmD [Gammaproteobacteria bacterium]|nr:tRNA (guanosine(37)-N1)-methyltransferase TrmD [Gammaproteobacteria bacterium]
MAIRVAVISIFPGLIEHYFSQGVARRARDCGLDLKLYDLRAHGLGVHQSVDDRPYGGGPGMVLRADVLYEALLEARQWVPDAKVIAFSPLGQRVTQPLIEHTVSQETNLILFCGRYEGFDQRFLDLYVDNQWSIGDFVLSGGELAAIVVLDAMARLLPGVLSCAESARLESFSANHQFLDYPHYTRPEVFHNQAVPEILKSGHHAQISNWREQQAIALTQQWRPDLLDKK